MRSGFSPQRRRITASSTPQIDETYDLRGLNLTDPDQVMGKGETPYTINSRMYARNAEDTRVAIRTRKGTGFFSTPIGEALDTQNVDTSTGDLLFGEDRVVAQPWTAGGDGALTKVELHLKKLGAATGHILVDVFDNNSGVPGNKIGSSSILASSLSTSYQYLPAYFIDAPLLNGGDQYFTVVSVQDGTGQYALNQTADSGALDKVSLDYGVSWSNLGVSFRYKAYLSPQSGIKGFTLRYPSTKINRIVMAQDEKIYALNKSTGIATEIDAHVDANSRAVRFENIDDKTIWVDGEGAARWWNGTDTPTVMPGVTGTPNNVIAFKNRLFFITDNVLVKFSELYDFETYPSVNFFYVPNPKSPDVITGWCIFQDNLVIFTHETKYIISGSDISSFTQRQSVGTKGAVSQEAIAVDRNYIYFMADDGQIYRFNGVSDELISGKMQPEFDSIQDKKGVRFTIYRNQLRVYYPKKPNPIPDRMALLDIDYKQWFMDTGKPLIGGTELFLDDNELIEFSSRVGQVFYGEQNFSDVGKPIDFKYWTKYNSYTSGASKDRIKMFRPILRTTSANYDMMIGKDIDFQNSPDMRPYTVNGEGATWGNFKWGDGTRWGKKKLVDNRAGMSGRGKHTQYRFEKEGVETPVEIIGYIAIYKAGRPK